MTHYGQALCVLKSGATVAVWVLQHLARSSKQHSMKHLILTDSMSCSLALSKGRSSMSSMNRICRQVGAVLLATGMRISCRWIPSELNPADSPSRGKPWRYFDAQAVAADWVEYAPTSKPVRTQGWRYEALQQAQRELRLRAEGDCRRSVEATHGQKPCVEAEQENGESQPTAETVQPQTRGHESSKRSYLSGEEVRHSGPGAFLPFGLAQAPSCIPSRQSLCAVDRGVGPSSHCPRECHVCGGPRPCRCPHSGGRHQVHATRCEENLRPDSHHASFQGIRETGTVLGAGPHAVSLPGPGRAVPPRGGSSHGGSVGVAHMGRVFKARRNFEVTVEASHSSVPSPAEMDGSSQQPGCPRKCSAFEGGRKGRSRGDRSTILGLAGPGADETPAGKAPNVAIFQFDMEHGSTWFRKALTALKYADAGLNCCYQIRHGSASTDQLQNLRSLADTMKNGGRVAEVFEALTNRQQQEAIQAEKRIPSMLSRSPRAALRVSAR